MTGPELKHARKQLGNLTQAALAERLGVTPNTCARWEQPKGGFPIPKYVETILALWLNKEQEAQP